MIPHVPMTPVQQLIRQCRTRLCEDPSVQYNEILSFFSLNGPARARGRNEERKVLWKHGVREAAVSLLGLLTRRKLGSLPPAFTSHSGRFGHMGPYFLHGSN